MRFGLNDMIYQDLRFLLSHSFNSLEDVVFFYMPSSSERDYKERHDKLHYMLVKDFNIRGSLRLVKYISSGSSGRLSKTRTEPELEFNKKAFKGKQVIIFDDIITSGRHMLEYKSKLESWGAQVICCISLGRTHHTHESHAIDLLREKYESES